MESALVEAAAVQWVAVRHAAIVVGMVLGPGLAVSGFGAVGLAVPPPTVVVLESGHLAGMVERIHLAGAAHRLGAVVPP